MDDAFPFDTDLLFAPADDELHPPGPEQNWTETMFFAFHVEERSLGGWLYVSMRPNVGVVAGGAFVFDPTGWLPWEAAYNAFFSHQPLPDPLDLRDVRFSTGVSVRCLEPGMRYALGYELPGRTAFLADLVFEGITPPVPHVSGEPPFEAASHYDQHGRVTGTIELHGETIPVDCISVRDRSWGPRPEVRDRDLLLSYCFGASTAEHAFLAFSMPPPADPMSETEHLFGGYLVRDGRTRRLETLTRRNVRDPETGGVERIELDGADTDGRRLRCVGTTRSRFPLMIGNEVAMMSHLHWTFGDGDGLQEEGWGEDQAVTPLAYFGARRRNSARPPGGS